MIAFEPRQRRKTKSHRFCCSCDPVILRSVSGCLSLETYIRAFFVIARFTQFSRGGRVTNRFSIKTEYTTALLGTRVRCKIFLARYPLSVKKVVFRLYRRLYKLCEWVLMVWPRGARWSNSSGLHERVRADHDQGDLLRQSICL